MNPAAILAMSFIGRVFLAVCLVGSVVAQRRNEVDEESFGPARQKWTKKLSANKE